MPNAHDRGVSRRRRPHPETLRAETLHAEAAPGTGGAGRVDGTEAPTAAGAPPEPGAIVAGYRLVRVLGEGERATVHLGFAEGATPGEPPRHAAVKVYRPGVALDAIDTEIGALARVGHPHVVALVDVGSLPSGAPCLVLERVAGSSLARLLAERGEISAGEAVTLVAPIASAVDELHRCGVLHGRVRATSVVFRESGAPVLVGFGHARLITPSLPPAALALDPGVAAERRQLALLAAAVLERVPGDIARTLLDELADDGADADDYGTRLADRLFELAAPEPVRLVRDGQTRPGGHVAAWPLGAIGAGPIVTRVDPDVHRRETGRAGRPAADSRGIRSMRAGPHADGVFGAATAWFSSWAARVRPGVLREWASGVRPRFWVAAGGVALSLLVALAVVPQGAGDRSAAGGPSGQPSVEHSGAIPASESSEAGEPGTDLPGSELPDLDGPALDPVAGDDPVAALVALLDERDRCVRDLSVLCLDGVVQSGSAASDHDAAVVRAIQGGAETADAAIVANAPVLVERLGDTALVSLGDVPQTQPASTLVMRGEAGWRIRDYVGE